MQTAVAVAFDAVSFAAIMVLVVLGLGIIASMMGVFNFAHGEFILLGAGVLYATVLLGLPGWVGLFAAPVLVGGFGVVAERLVIRRFYTRPIAAMLATYALSLFVRESMRAATDGRFWSVKSPLDGAVNVLGVELSKWRIVIAMMALVVVLASYLVLQRTRVGLWVRGALDNPQLARASGIPTSIVYSATFAYGAALAGLAGALIVPLYSLHADLGVRFLLMGFLAVMLGGAGSFEGALLGAALIGATSAALPWAISPVVTDFALFATVIAFIKLRPGGLLGGRAAPR